MTLLGAFGGYTFKKLSAFQMGINKNFIGLFMLGGSLYLGGAIVNIILLRYLPYTILYPITSFTYVWTLLISYFLLSEKITLRKALGVVLIICGAFYLIK